MIQYRVTWPNGRESVLSEEALNIYKQYYRSAPWLGMPEWYEALLAAERVENEEAPDES